VDRLHGVDQRALDRLLDPPRGIGREARALRGVEALDGADEADVAFLDEVGERQAAVHIVLGDRDDQAQVGADHPVLCGRVVVVDDAPTEILLLLGIQQGDLVDLLQIEV